MIKCDYCDLEIYDENECVHGYEEKYPEEILTVCKDCAKLRDNFIKLDNFEEGDHFELNICKNVYLQFVIQYIENDPCTINQELFTGSDFYDVYAYAKEKYHHKLVGISFEAYVDEDGNELSYDPKNKWFEVLK